jgi:hypothetical protein
MPIYKVQAPDGKVYRIQGPANANPEDLFATIAEQNPMAVQTTAELEAAPSAPSSFGDVAKSLGAGIIGGGKSLVDLGTRSTDQLARVGLLVGRDVLQLCIESGDR